MKNKQYHTVGSKQIQNLNEKQTIAYRQIEADQTIAYHQIEADQTISYCQIKADPKSK